MSGVGPSLDGAWWTGVRPLAEALPGLPPRALLHAGPPLGEDLPAPVEAAAVQAILFEGWAEDEAGARALLAGGAVRLLPAQPLGVATPLAQVVGPGAPVFVVQGGGLRRLAPLVEGPAPALRFCDADPGCRARLREVAEALAPALDAHLAGRPLAVGPLASAGLAAGDENHARTGAANAALAEALSGAGGKVVAAVSAHPGVVLPLLMAAAALRLALSAGALRGLGGNGRDLGALGPDGSWRTVPAPVPRGPRLPGREAAEGLPAIGDSAVLDACGYGGQSLARSPPLVAEWAAFLPPGAAGRGEAVTDPATGILDPARIRASGLAPLVHLAMLGRSGGLLGRGHCELPPALFAG